MGPTDLNIQKLNFQPIKLILRIEKSKMLNWLETLSWYEKILWSVSIIATILFLLQLLTTVIVENPRRKREKIFSRFFSFKNICAFLSMMGWVSISCIYQGFSLSTSLLIGVVSGIVMMLVMSVLFYLTEKLKDFLNK